MFWVPLILDICLFHSCMCFYVFLLFWTFVSLIVVFVFISSLLLLLERFMHWSVLCAAFMRNKWIIIIIIIIILWSPPRCRPFLSPRRFLETTRWVIANLEANTLSTMWRLTRQVTYIDRIHPRAANFSLCCSATLGHCRSVCRYLCTMMSQLLNWGLHCVSERISDIFSCNLSKHCPHFIIVGTKITQRLGNQNS